MWGEPGHSSPSWPMSHTQPCFTHSEPPSLLALGTSQGAFEGSGVLGDQFCPERALKGQDHPTHPHVPQILSILPFRAPARIQRPHLVRVTQQAKVALGLPTLCFGPPTATLSKSWRCGHPCPSSAQGARRSLPPPPHPRPLPTGGWECPDCFRNQS